MINYKLTENPSLVVLMPATFIPEGNTQWLDYQDWLKIPGNDPLPADIPPTPDPIYQWDAFTSQLVSVAEGSAYRQLTDWAKTLPAFGDCKSNLIFAINNQNVQSIQYLQFALADLKQTAELPNVFTDIQIAEINSCLETLGVIWRWGDL